MLIVDSQVHIWGANTPERPWPARQAVKPQRDTPWTKDELLGEMNAAGVDRVEIVPPSWEGERNDLAIAAAQAHPGRFAVMGRINPVLPESRGRMAAWRRQPGMLGVPLRVPPLAAAGAPHRGQGRLVVGRGGGCGQRRSTWSSATTRP